MQSQSQGGSHLPRFAGIFGGRDISSFAEIVAAFTTVFGERGAVAQYVNREIGLSVVWLVHGGEPTPADLVWNDRHDVALLLFGDPHVDRVKAPTHTALSRGNRGAPLSGDIFLWYDKIGTSFPRHITGWFSGMLIDIAARTAYLFNDRFGLGRVYTHDDGTHIHFASEAKVLLRARPELRSLDPNGIGEWLSCGCVMGNRSLFKHVSLMPIASIWIAKPHSPVVRETYFKPEEWCEQELLPELTYYNRLTETFKTVLPNYLGRSDKQAISLTGGVDSRMIMAWAGMAPGALPAYAFSGPYRRSHDVAIASKVASICGQPFQTIPVGPKFFSDFPSLAEDAVYISDGTLDVSGAVELFVNAIAKQIAPIRITGSYGGEVLRGLLAFKPNAVARELYSTGVLDSVAMAAQTYNEHLKGNLRSFIAFKQVPWHHYGRFVVEQSQLLVRTPFLDNSLVSVAFSSPFPTDHAKLSALHIIRAGCPRLATVRTDRELFPPSNPLIRSIYRTFQRFTFRAEYAYDVGMPQWLSKVDATLSPLHLERLFIGRHRFYHFRLWYKNQLSSHIKEVLLDPRTLSRPIINRRAVERLVNSHINGTINATAEIQQLLSLEHIHRRLLAC